MEYTNREKRLVELLRTRQLSPSHELDHLERVAGYCRELAEIYQARVEVVVAAALVHDLGRSDKKFRAGESAREGARLAEPVLREAGYGDEVDDIVRCVAEHDQPELHSEMVEARILKDADFLEGFGARGIMRSIMYSTEVGEGVAGAMERMRVKMRKRLDGLEFVESKRLGWKKYRLVELFLAELEETRLSEVGARGPAAVFSPKTPTKGTFLGVPLTASPLKSSTDTTSVLEQVGYPGKLVVVEGISGSGKDTQADRLAKWLDEKGKEVVRVNHPTGEFKEKVWRTWRGMADDRYSELFLMLADRVRMVNQVIKPALMEGKIVVSTRSSISAVVYQVIGGVDASQHRFCFGFEPVADLILYFDISAEEALRRTDTRVEMGQEKDRGFFGKKQVEMQQRYEDEMRHYPNVVRVDGNGNEEEVWGRVRKIVEESGLVD